MELRETVRGVGPCLRKARVYSGNQKISRVVWNLRFRYRVYKVITILPWIKQLSSFETLSVVALLNSQLNLIE